MPNRFIVTALTALCLAAITFWFQQTAFNTDVLLGKCAADIQSDINRFASSDSTRSVDLVYEDGRLKHWSGAEYSVPRLLTSSTDFFYADAYGGGWMEHVSGGSWHYFPIYSHVDEQFLFFALDEGFSNLKLVKKGEKHRVVLPDGSPLGAVSAVGFAHPKLLQWLFGGWLCLAFLAGIYSIILLGRYAKERFNSAWGGFVIIGGLFGVQFLLRWIDFPGYMPDLAVFNKAFYLEGMGKHLAFLLLESGMLLWIMVVFHRYFRMSNLGLKTVRSKFMVVVVMNWAILAGMGLVIDFVRNIVLESGIDFHLENVPNLGLAEMLAIISVCLMSLAYFIFSHRMVLDTSNLELNSNTRLLALLLALLLVLPWGYVLDVGMPVILYGMMGLIYVLLFDVYRESNRSSFTWLLLWLILFGAFSSGLLYKFQLTKDEQLAKQLVEKLSEQKDSIAMTELGMLKDQLFDDPIWQQFADSMHNDGMIKSDVTLALSKYLKEFDYLKRYYDCDLHVVDIERKTALIKGDGHRVTHEAKLLIRATDSLTNKVHHYKNWDDCWYWAYDEIKGNRAVTVLLGVRPKDQIVIDEKIAYQGETQWKNYSFGIWQDDELQTNNGEQVHYFEEMLLNLSNQEVARVSKGELVAQLYKNNDIGVVVTNEVGDFYRPMTLFAFVFLLLVVITIGLVGLNYYFRGVVISEEFPLFWSGSLRNKIQLYVVLLTLLCFIGIGVVTISSFKNAAIKREIADSRSLFDNISKHLAKLFVETEDDSKATVINQIYAVANFYKVTANIYNEDGLLEASNLSAKEQHNRVIPLMDPALLASYIQGGVTSVIAKARNYKQEETVGGLKLIQATKTPLFAEFVMDTHALDLQEDEMDFLGGLLNIYVFLLLIAVVVGIVIANSITEPIVQMGEKLKQLKLGKNEPLNWKSNDEIGALVSAYNNTISQLEESTEKLKDSERQGAWREMAKQVAHEIKNPLTPMKLNIQLLQRALKTDPEQAQDMAKRMADGLVTQIETLAQIATEFSNFAKMPTVKKRPFVIHDLLQITYDFFKDGHPEIDFTLTMPPTRAIVQGDKEQLTRVFNNLIRNGIQALVEDRKGRIDIHLDITPTHAIIAITDNGTGIPEEIGKKVFQPNFTTKSSGMGLGLAMTKGIIESCDGYIDFKTQENQGTTFFVGLETM